MRSPQKQTICIFAAALSLVSVLVACALFVPPVRNKIFSTKLWPFKTPWDATDAELATLMEMARPGDVIIESNLHGWQWMLLSLLSTGTSWVHAALVDENKNLITVHEHARQLDFDIYSQWQSTRMLLIRPPYLNEDQVATAISFARSQIGTKYDPSFREHAGNCNGLVAHALSQAGIKIATRSVFGREIYAPDCFLKIPGAQIIWRK